jgi:hypothetical protein
MLELIFQLWRSVSPKLNILGNQPLELPSGDELVIKNSIISHLPKIQHASCKAYNPNFRLDTLLCLLNIHNELAY